MPIRDKFQKLNKKHSEINLRDECGLFEWNGEETILGNTATTVTILPDQTLSKNYVPLPGHNKKATVCGKLYKDVFFADKVKTKTKNEGLFEIYVKNDYDLNIPIEPNSSYSEFRKWGRTSATEVEDGYEGEIQFDSQTPSTIALENDNKSRAEVVLDDVKTTWNFLVDKAKKLNDSDDPIEIIEKVASTPMDLINELDPNTYLRDKFIFWKELKKDINVCVYGSACTDGLNSKNSIVGEGTKTEIHPVEQLWYRSNSGQINFAVFRDYSNRFDKAEKNTNRTPWLNNERRKFAYPITIKVEQGKFNDDYIAIHNKGFRDINVAQTELEEAIFLNVRLNNSTRSRLTVYLSKERIDNKRYFSNFYSKNSNPELEFPFYVEFEDVHRDRKDTSLIHAMLVISRHALYPGIYTIYHGLNEISSISPKFALKIAKKESKEKAKREAKSNAVEAVIETASNSEILMVKSAKILKQSGAQGNLFTVVIEPQKGQNLDGYKLISDENINVLNLSLELRNDKNKIKEDKLSFNIALKSKNNPLFITLEKGSIKKKVYLKD